MSANVLTERQEILLESIIREYMKTAEPVSSLELKQSTKLDISPATIRNDLRTLSREGFIEQPHTSAGRVPTKKAYRYFADKIENEHQRQAEEFIMREVRFAHQEMEKEIRMIQEIMNTLDNGDLFEILTILEKWRKI